MRTTAKNGGNATSTKVREREGQPQTERGEGDTRKKKKREEEAENHRKEEEGTEPPQKRTEGTAIKWEGKREETRHKTMREREGIHHVVAGREATTRERDNHPFLLFGGGGSFSSLPLLRCGGSSPLFLLCGGGGSTPGGGFLHSLSLYVSLVRTVGGGRFSLLGFPRRWGITRKWRFRSLTNESSQKKFSRRRRRRRRRLHISTRKWYGYLGREVLKSGNPTQCGKIPQEEKNTAVIFMEQRTNQKNKMARKQNMISAVLLGASFVVILFKIKDTKFYVLQESSFLHPTQVRWRCRADKYHVGRIAGKSNVWSVERRRWSRPWKSFTQFTQSLVDTTSHLKDTCGPGERLRKLQETSRPENMWPEVRSKMSKYFRKKRKTVLDKEKPNLDSARKLRGISSVDPEDMEFKETMKKSAKSFGMASGILQCRANCERPQGHHPQNSAFKRLKKRDHENHIAAEEYTSMGRHHLVHKLVPMPQAIKIPDAKSRSWQGVEQTDEFASMARLRSKVNKRLSSRHRRQNSSLLQQMWACATSNNVHWTHISKNTQAVLHCVATLWKSTQARVLCSPSRDLPRHTWQPPKFWT